MSNVYNNMEIEYAYKWDINALQFKWSEWKQVYATIRPLTMRKTFTV